MCEAFYIFQLIKSTSLNFDETLFIFFPRCSLLD